jgi:hypothetical protein
MPDLGFPERSLIGAVPLEKRWHVSIPAFIFNSVFLGGFLEGYFYRALEAGIINVSSG